MFHSLDRSSDHHHGVGECILTAPRLNAVIRAVVARAVNGYGWRVFGLHQGTRGVLARPVDAMELELNSVSAAMLRLAGTILDATNRSAPFCVSSAGRRGKDRSGEVIEGIRLLGLDALMLVAMAVSRSCPGLPSRAGVPLIGIPKRIDDDVGVYRGDGGDRGDRPVQPKAASHDRVVILEVIRRDSGQIALVAGIAGGADVILVPEIPNVAAHISKLRHGTHNAAIVVVAEGVRNDTGEHVERRQALGNVTYDGIGHVLAESISRMTGAETRVTVLGHVQRGDNQRGMTG